MQEISAVYSVKKDEFHPVFNRTGYLLMTTVNATESKRPVITAAVKPVNADRFNLVGARRSQFSFKFEEKEVFLTGVEVESDIIGGHHRVTKLIFADGSEAMVTEPADTPQPDYLDIQGREITSGDMVEVTIQSDTTPYRWGKVSRLKYGYCYLEFEDGSKGEFILAAHLYIKSKANSE